MEVALALGLASFGFVAVFGMIPTGMTVFRQTIDTSVGSQIAQRIINEVKQTDFDVLMANSTGSANETFRLPIRYFSDQGDELTSAAGAIYQVNIRVVPGTAANFVSQPSQLVNFATVTIQIASNPAKYTLAVTAAKSPSGQYQPLGNLWDGTATPSTTAIIPLSTWSTYVARNR